MKTIQLTNCDVSALVDDDIYAVVGNKKWHRHSGGYVIRFEGPAKKMKMIYLHRLVMNAKPGTEVDHIDRSKLNNQRSNLRLCNKSQNQGNRNGSRPLGFKGVSWCKRDAAWRAYITKNRKLFALGTFRTEIDAAKAYNTAASKHFGEFALLNLV